MTAWKSRSLAGGWFLRDRQCKPSLKDAKPELRYRRVFCRFDKLDVLFLGFIVLALIVEALRFSVNRP